ncbi:NAD-dependent epimerase/dehydratase family protein [Brevibacillus fluminis]|uniref:NAD-dependent epimerase/dehydratase family protein n=2 Tax=Brevibacillus fluminis TaxID=511487 RepID=A0A3M8D5L8_9BACL|nr:NAD-dependent epimerase/dehydratase family protein [Brevibacillus fluminis]
MRLLLSSSYRLREKGSKSHHKNGSVALPSTLSWMMERKHRMNILITGGAGFIGANLCRFLLEQHKAERVIAVDSFHSYYDPAIKRKRMALLEKLPGFCLVETDILDTAAMSQLMEKEKPDAIIHLAAIPGVRGSLDDPLGYVDVDVKGTVQMLELARKYGIARIVAASSSSVYGERAVDRSFCESEPDLNPISPYAASKAAAELFCRTYTQLYGMHVTALRFFTVYGPGQRPDMAISKFVKSIMEDKPITVFDLQSVRDYTYVDDIVRGIWAAVQQANGWQVYNLGSGHPVSLLELVRLLEQTTGKSAHMQRQGAQPGDVSGTWANTEQARERLGWSAEVSLPDGLRRYVEWWLRQ